MCTKAGSKIHGVPEEILFRHVLPEWIDGGQPSSQAFRPTRESDEDCLSLDRGSRTTACAAFTLFTSLPPEGFGGQACGVWGISCAEISDAGLDIWDDPLAARPPHPANPHHAVADFEGIGAKDQVRVARKLKLKAVARGCLHPAATSAPSNT